MKKITLVNRPSYGNNRYWPSCELSQMLAKIIARKTIPARVIAILKKGGYDIEIQQPTQGDIPIAQR